MQDKKRLIKLHNQLKEHLFRQTGDKTYLNDYLLEYRNFIDAFEDEFPYEVRKEDKKADAISRMYHDCNASISICRNAKKYYDGVRAEYLEMCLMVFHRWLDFNEVPVFYQLWHRDGEAYIVKFVLIEDENISEYYNITEHFNKENLAKSIEYWTEEVKEKPEYKKHVKNLQYFYDNFEKLMERINND